MTTPSVDIGYWSGSFTYWPATGPQAGQPQSVSIGTGVDANGVAWVWEKIDGWDSPDTAGSVIQRGGDHGGWPALQVYAPRSMTVTIRASAPTQALRDVARAALQRVIPVNELCLMTYNEPIPKQCWVRRSGRIAESYDNLTEVEFTIVLVAPDPRKYSQVLKVSPGASYVAQNYITIGAGTGGPNDNFLQPPQSNFEGGIGSWTQAGNCSVAANSANVHSGGGSLAITCTTAGQVTIAHVTTAGYATGQMMGCNAGDTVTGYVWALAGATPRNVSVGFAFFTAAGAGVGSPLYGTAVADSTSAWTQVTVSVTVPATAVWCRLNVQIPALVLNEVHYIDDAYMYNASRTDIPLILANNPPPATIGNSNQGNLETRPVVTINGPLHAPGLQLQSSGQTVSWSQLVLNTGDILVVDFDAKMAWVNPSGVTLDVPLQAANPLSGYVAADVWSSWFTLEPGTDSINLLSGSSVLSDAGIMIARSRDAWI